MNLPVNHIATTADITRLEKKLDNLLTLLQQRGGQGWMKLSAFNQETNQKWTSAKCSRLAAKGCDYVRQEEAGRAWRVNIEGYYKSLEG